MNIMTSVNYTTQRMLNNKNNATRSNNKNKTRNNNNSFSKFQATRKKIIAVATLKFYALNVQVISTTQVIIILLLLLQPPLVSLQYSSSSHNPSASAAALTSSSFQSLSSSSSAESLFEPFDVDGTPIDNLNGAGEGASEFGPHALAQHSSSSLSSQGGGSNNLAAGGEKPRVIPIVAAESGYSENSSVNILCTVSQGHHETLTFDWFKDGQLLPISSPSSSSSSSGLINNNNNQLQDSPLMLATAAEYSAAAAGANLNFAPQIEKHQDHSLLRIAHVQSHHSGRYTCAVKNQFGHDSSSVQLLVNVKLQWVKEPPKEIVVRLNQELKVDCFAHGEPKPLIRWEKLEAPNGLHQQLIQSSSNTNQQTRYRSGPHGSLSSLSSLSSSISSDGLIGQKNQLSASPSNSNGYKLSSQQQQQYVTGSFSSPNQNSVMVSSNRYLNIQRAKESDSGIYECIASNSHDSDLRKLVHVQVRGK